MAFIVCPIQRHAIQSPSKPAIIDNQHVISYGDLNQKIHGYEIALRRKGIKALDHVAIFSSTTIDLISILFAIWRIGAIVCVLNIRNPPQTIQQQLNEVNAKLLLTNKKEILHSKIISLPKIYLPDFPSVAINTPKTIKYNSNQSATILFTSGSSDRPKAALHSLGNHIYNALGSNENIRLKSGDRWLLSLPLYHVSGMGILFRNFLAGTTIVIPDEKSLSQTIKQYSITHLSLVTTQLQELLKSSQKFPTLKAVLLGGSAIPEALLTNALKKKLPIYISYGLTETASQVATSSKLKSVAQRQANILKYRQVKITKSDEICIKGKVLFLGYLINRKLMRPFDHQGWFHTGDLGLLNKKLLTVTGRKDNMFISGGENIQPEEIEKHLLMINDIQAAVVIPVPDKQFGFRPLAFLKSSKISSSKIIKLLKMKLPQYKIPVQFLPWPKQLPAGIKINRQDFKKYLRLV